MKFFRKSHTENKNERAESVVNEQPINADSLKPHLTAQEAAALWFEHRYGEPIPESLITLFRSLTRTEIMRKQADSTLLKPAETDKLNEALRLNETKLKSIESGLDKLFQQQEWYRKFMSLSQSLDREKHELYQLNKQYASIQSQVQELERFETFEAQQGAFLKIEFIEQFKNTLKNYAGQILEEKEEAERDFNLIEEDFKQQTGKKKECEATLKRINELIAEVSLNKGKLQILELIESKESDNCNQWTMQISTLKKEIDELKQNIEDTTLKQEALSQARQEIEVHQKMIEKGEGVLVKLDLFNILKNNKDSKQQELDQALKKQSEQNNQLNKLFVSIKDLESQIHSLQNELSMHLKSNYGLDGEKLQYRTMELKRRMQMLQSAQVLWKQISKGYLWIDTKKQEIYRLHTQKDSTQAAMDKLATEVNILKGKTEEKKYAFTVSKSQDVIQLRSDLKEGSSCSVCGATHHPYHADTMLEQSKLISEMRTDMEITEAEFQKKSLLLQEMKMKFAQESGIVKVEEEHLKMLQDMHRDNVLEWKKFEDLDRSFKDCSASTNQDARRSMLQQLIERTEQDAQDAEKELEIFNFHQTHINSINGKISRKENEKNDVMMRFNELNTGCQVWAYRISRLQDEMGQFNERFSEMYEELDKSVSITGWFKAWNNSHEGLKMQIQNILKKYKELDQDARQCKEQQNAYKLTQKLLNERMTLMVQAHEASAQRWEQALNLKKECNNTLQKLLQQHDAKQMHDEATHQLAQAERESDKLLATKEQFLQNLYKKIGALEQLETYGKEMEQMVVLQKSELDLWMRKYNASHSPVQFAELQNLFRANTDWQQIRKQTRDLQFNLSIAQKKVDLLQAELASHQANGNCPAESADQDVSTILVERKESMEQERKNILEQIASCRAKLIGQEEKLNVIRLCEEEIKNQITE